MHRTRSIDYGGVLSGQLEAVLDSGQVVHLGPGDMQFHSYPACGGREGAGVVEAIGPGVTRVRPGDHVVTSFIAACGHCRMCVTGHQNLRDAGHLITVGTRPGGTFRMHTDGQGIAQNARLSTFSEWTTVRRRTP